MKKLILILFLLLPLQGKAGGIPVFDGVRHITDIIDNIQDLLDQVNQIKNQVEQIKKLTEQIDQMDDYLKRVGKAAEVAVRTEELFNDDIKEIIKEIDEYIYGEGTTPEEEQEHTDLYGDINKKEHTVENTPLPEKLYEKFENVEKEFAAYKKTADSISSKRLAILDELENLATRLNSASTDQEIQKINSSINAHSLMLDALNNEENKQYQSLQAATKRNENALAKERTRHQQRSKYLDLINRTERKVYRLKKSTEILKQFEGK